MLKNITMIIAAVALTGCASTESEFTTEANTIFKPDLKNYSTAYNIASAAGAPDALKDSDVSQNELNRISNASHAASFLSGFAMDGLSGAFSFGISSLSKDKANGFDKPLLTMWLEVDSLEEYGSSQFDEMVYEKGHKAFFDAFVGDDTIIKEVSSSKRSIGKYYRGEKCDHYNEQSDVPKAILEQQESCYLYSKISIIRPVRKGNWTPEALNLSAEKQYVVINFVLPNESSKLAPYLFDNAMTYRPSKWKFNVKGKPESEFKSYTTTMGYLSYQYKDQIHLFLTPDENGQRGSLTIKK